ncbi:MAG: hypothetical protein HYZ24_04180 [Chloroflexi bacterium]|nr:hypothetical protein [Chloroflexota bacterium]
MSNNSLTRFAGYAGVAGAIIMLTMTFTTKPGATPNLILALAGDVAGIVLTAGLYLLYRDYSSGTSLAAGGIAWIGYLLFVVIMFANVSHEPGSPLTTIADVSVYILGIGLFSVLALQSGRMPRALAYVGFFAALAGVIVYILMLGVKLELTSPAVIVSYMLYLIGVVVWLGWTGIALLKSSTVLATA